MILKVMTGQFQLMIQMIKSTILDLIQMKISWVSVDFDELFVDNILDNREEELEN